MVIIQYGTMPRIGHFYQNEESTKGRIISKIVYLLLYSPTLDHWLMMLIGAEICPAPIGQFKLL